MPECYLRTKTKSTCENWHARTGREPNVCRVPVLSGSTCSHPLWAAKGYQAASNLRWQFSKKSDPLTISSHRLRVSRQQQYAQA